MAPPRRHNIGASRRRRREDEGEDEGSLDGEVEDDSLSEGSVISQQDEDDADGEGSDESEDDNISIDNPNRHQTNGRAPGRHQGSRRRHSASPRKAALTTTVSDTAVMLNGLKIADDGKGVAEIHFNDLRGELEPTGRTPSAPPTEAASEPFSDRKRREGEKAMKEKEEDPTLVPKRGSFFLHDQRSTESGTNGHKYNKSKTRPYGLIVDGNVRRKPDITTEGQWTHDLHDTVAKDDPPATRNAHVPTYSAYSNKNIHTTVRTAPSTTPPNRQFGGSMIVGNVPIVVYIPGMDRPVSLPPAVKRQHTLLPQHRPPLRRDKPVRVSLPNSDQPGYVFPSLDRSFIFIPRAMRPNQQTYRGRGRGGFFGGRRPSLYANSTYTPSVAMSRRSSFGKPPSQDGYHSPAASVASRHTVVTTENGKPVVRLPPPRPPGAMPAAAPVLPIPPTTIHPQAQTQIQQPIWRESRPAPIPMHQPRPQKAVSLADIETPASFPANPPPAQQEQPFHHQVPYGPDASTGYPPPAHTVATPLSQIPERPANVPPFQLYGFQQPQPYYPGPYQPGPAYYPVAGTEYIPYNNSGAGPGAPFPTGQNVPYMVSGTHTPSEPPSQGGPTVAHESNGTVYYLDASQMYPGSPFGAPPTGAAVGMGGMMAPSTTYYYPQHQGSYYPPQ
ncbi:hypothetical protein ASPCAL09821 [Aspergillus calidoustus]|uniref:Btz domain-containing protein n=1 Tax=Aspergillus calidoustus TaxID=454130 RepID=A0A0U5CBH3_ASPCI|nr:hypothetical protein ASPCAL09821 [Aspergillus calidoustus]